VDGRRCALCRSDLLAVLSHELRNPLAAMSNGLYVLTKSLALRTPGDDDARVTRALALMERQLQHMTALIDNLADAARLDGGALELHATEVDLAALVRDACHDLEHLFVGRGLEFRREFPDDALRIWADATRLRQVVGNLLHNAAQFTPSGRVVVGLTLDRAAGHARLCVHDTGVGFAAELRQRLFLPPAPEDGLSPGGRAGLGLGLALVKGIVDLHGGAVRAESAGPGRGSTFIVELPWPDARRLRLRATEASST
jgi:signal transduction histidine kinase